MKLMSRAEGRGRDEQLLRQIVDAVRTMRHGRVELIVQDSRVIQINRTEKVRVDTREMRDAMRKGEHGP